MSTLLLIILIILLLGALPTWPYSAGWGYYPSGGLGLVRDDRHCPAADGQRYERGGGLNPQAATFSAPHILDVAEVPVPGPVRRRAAS